MRAIAINHFANSCTSLGSIGEFKTHTRELSQNLGESNFTAVREPKEGRTRAAAQSPGSREPPTPPLRKEGAETPLGAEEAAGRRGGGRQTLPTRL